MNPYANIQHFDGAGVRNSILQGYQMGQQFAQQNALSQFAQNPDDPKAQQEMARRNPQQYMQWQERRRAEQLRGLETRRDDIVKGAKIVRQLGVKDQAGWDMARSTMAQMGIDISGVPQQFDPGVVQQALAIADSLSPERNDATTMQRDYEFLQGKDPALAEQYLRNKSEGAPMIANNGDGTFTIIPRGQMGGNQAPPPQQDMPSVATPQDAMRLPPGTRFRMPDGRIGTVPGGTGGNVSGGFPGN